MNTETSLPPLDLTTDLKELMRLAGAEDGLDELLRKGLDWLARIAPYDLATIFSLQGEDLRVRAARGALAGPSVRGHHLSLGSFPSLREVLELRRARVFTEDDHAHGDGDPFDHVLDLPPGHACMVVPLVAGDRAFGVMTLDRARCERYSDDVVSLCEVYAQVLALAIASGEQRALLARALARDEERVKLLERQLHGDEDGILESSLSPKVVELARRARLVAETPTPVLILGETGTGKEKLARAVHRWSPRRDLPFVAINCAAIPPSLLESELFGHVRGAFTGAVKDRAGRFQVANGGTLFLDEIGELPQELQAKLLRVLQDGCLTPVGADRMVKVDVRLLAATHVDLPRAVQEGRFRADLYYRLNVFPLALPPLRERREDLPLLCQVLLEELRGRASRPPGRMAVTALKRLSSYSFPGNIRELANLLERASILSSGGDLVADLFDVEGEMASQSRTLPGVVSLEEAERVHIGKALEEAAGKIYGRGGAAEILGLKPSTLQSRMKKLGMGRPS